MNFLFEILRYLSIAYTECVAIWMWIWSSPEVVGRPVKRYFLSDEYEFDESHEFVPEDSIYIEEWERNGEKKCYVYYEGEDIPKEWFTSPWDIPVKSPWIWVGDKETEIDLTRTFNRFLVVGNKIELALVLKLIQVTEKTNLIYIEAGTFKECKFPGDGIAIEQDDA